MLSNLSVLALANVAEVMASNTAAQIKIEPNEDDIIIFPSKTFHSTSPSESNNERISISADVSLISKTSNKIEKFITPISEWQKFK